LGIAYGIGSMYSLVKLQLAYHALRRAGRPLTLKSVIPAPVVDHNNAALLYTSAITRLKAEPAGNRSLMEALADLLDKTSKGEPNEVIQNELNQYIDSDLVSSALELIKQGTQRTGCRFDVDYNDGFEIQMKHLMSLRTLNRLMAYQIDRLASNDPQKAWKFVDIMLQFCEATRDEPLLVNQLVRIALINTTLQSIQDLCKATPLSQDHVQHFHKIYPLFEAKSPLVKSIDGERLICDNSFFQSPFQPFVMEMLNMDNGQAWLFNTYMKAAKPVFWADHAYYLNTMLQVTLLFEKPFHEFNEEEFLITERCPKYYIMSHLIMPAMYRVNELYTMMLARLRITKVGVNLIERFQTTQTFPDTLVDFPQEESTDPFTGKPLIYRKETKGFILYSLNTNKQDDNGTTDPKHRREGDIVWQYSLPD